MSQEFNITVLPGDGIGPEVIREAIKILKIIENKKGLKLNLTEAPVGWRRVRGHGSSPAGRYAEIRL